MPTSIFALELSKQHAWVFAVDIDQHVESATVRHTYDNFFDARTASSVDDFIQQRDQALAAFQRESLLADVLFVQVFLEISSGGEPAQDVALFVGVELWATAHLFHPALQPAFLFGRRDVREFGADSPTIGVLQQAVDAAQGLLGVGEQGARVEEGIHVLFGEIVIRRVEVGNARVFVQAPAGPGWPADDLGICTALM